MSCKTRLNIIQIQNWLSLYFKLIHFFASIMADFIKKGNKRTRDSDEPKTPTTSTTTITTRSKDQNIFEHDIDSYKCASVLLTKIESFDSFKLKLDETISFWKKNGVRGVWFKLTKDLLVGSEQILPYLLKNNFAIHHADGDHIVLTTWLVSGPNTLPQVNFHYFIIFSFIPFCFLISVFLIFFLSLFSFSMQHMFLE